MSKIPKVIHFCWFGGAEYPELIKKCIASWEKYLPEYEIIKWSEENFDINCNQYVKEAYENKKWANAKTEDGSMWVWIPRYAYKVVYNDPSDKSKADR